MHTLRRALTLVLAVMLIITAVFVTGNYEVRDRLVGVFLMIQSWLPAAYGFEQFLVILLVASLLLVALALGACALLLTQLTAAKQQQLGQAIAVDREITYIKDQARHQHEELIAIGQALTKRFDKRVLIQSMLETTSRITSVAQANSVVSCWLLHFESNTIRFEKGLYCDETMFIQKEFQPTEPPFAHVITSQQPWVVPAWDESIPFVRREKASRLGSATAILIIPLVVESAVMGVLAVLCHPDAVKTYEQQKTFYQAVWGEMALGLAIAIEGEVTILDRLTGLYNREYFLKRLVQEIERSNRFRLPLSLLMIDIDNFKLVNDTLGHPPGDAVLRVVAKLIKKEVRAIDLVGRYGGEEFIVMLPETGYGEDSASSTGALAVAERVRKAVDEEFRGLQKPLNLTISVGVAVRRFPEERECDYHELIRMADEQLYRAKTSGKNKVRAPLHEKPQTVA